MMAGRKAKHYQFEFDNGENAGYFGGSSSSYSASSRGESGGVRSEIMDGKGYVELNGGHRENDDLMRRAISSVKGDFREDNYDIVYHNCQDFKKVVDKEYYRLLHNKKNNVANDIADFLVDDLQIFNPLGRVVDGVGEYVAVLGDIAGGRFKRFNPVANIR
jgi:hypothetical protein